MKKIFAVAILLMGMTQIQAQSKTEIQPKKISLEQRTEKYLVKMQREIGIDDDQKKKIYDLRLEKLKKVKEIRETNKGDEEKIKSEVKPVAKEYREGLKSILNEGQLEKWKVFRKAEHERAKAAKEKRKNNKNGKEVPLEDDDFMDSMED